MPQPGDGDLWPNTDDDKPRSGASAPADKPSSQVNEPRMNELPVPDQRDKPAAGGWFDPPATDDPTPESDKSHPRPAQQRTQPVSWPVAELERQAKARDGESTVFVKPVQIKPPPSNATQAATAFATPRKPDKSGPTRPGKSTRSGDPETPKPTDRGWFDSPTENTSSAEDQPPADDQPSTEAKPPAPKDKQDRSPAEAERDQPADPEKQSPAVAAEKHHPATAPQDDRPAQHDERPPEAMQGGRLAEMEQGEPPADAGQGRRPAETRPDGRPAEVGRGERSAEVRSGGRPGEVGRGERLAEVRPDGRPGEVRGGERLAEVRPDGRPAEVRHGERSAEMMPNGRLAEGEQSGHSAEAGQSERPAAEKQGEHPAEAGHGGHLAETRQDERPGQVGHPVSGRQDGSAEAGQEGSAEATPSGHTAEERQGERPAATRPAGRLAAAGQAKPLAELTPDGRPAGMRQGGQPAELGPDGRSAGMGQGGQSAELGQGGRPAEFGPDGRSAGASQGGQPAELEQGERPAETTSQPSAKAEQVAAEGRPASESATVNMAVPGSADESVEDASSPAEREADSTQAVSWPTEAPVPAEPVHHDAPEEQDKPAAGQPRGGHDRLAWPSADPPGRGPEQDSSAEGTTVFRPVGEPARGSGGGATSVFRPVEPPRADRPRQQEESATSLFRPPDQRPRQAPRQGVDSPTVNYMRPVQRPENPPSFVRPRQPAPESATVNLARPQERQSEWPPPEPPRAAPQRVGTPAAEEPATTRRSRKPLLITAIAIVAVIGIAAGVVFGVPGLAEKLGLRGTDTVEVAPPPGPIAYAPGLHGPASDAPTPTKQGVEQALAGPMANSALGTVTGVVIDPATGEALYERDAGRAITPASTGKLLTAAAALLSLDHTQQLVTKVVQGDRPGEVIIVGGGDPTISSLEPGNDDSVFKGAAHLSELVDQVKASGVQVDTVYIDQSRYAAPRMAPSWLPEDVGAGYIAPIVPAMLDGDRRDATKNYSPRTNDPGRTLVDEFARRVGASPAGDIEKKAPAGAKVLGEIRSAPVSQLVDNMLDHSENTLGDVLAHEVAVKAGQEPNFDGAAKAMLDVLRQNRFDVEGVVLEDGSGMSTENKVSAKLLAQVLAVAAGPDGKDERTAKLRPLLGGLPVAGGSGTLEDRYNQGSATEGRGWVRAKTGTLSGVNSLAGIVMDKDNRPLVFAFLTSGTDGNTARPALDTVAAALRGCGCQ